MPRITLTFTEPCEPMEETFDAATVEEATEMLLEDYPDAVVSASRIAADISKLVLQVINGAHGDGISEAAILAAVEDTRGAVLSCLRTLHSNGILLRKNRTRNYFICSAGREQANVILNS